MRISDWSSDVCSSDLHVSRCCRMSSAIALSDRRHAEQIAVLRAELACAQAARGLVLSFGIAAVDGRLADGGLDSAGLHEIAAASATLSDDAAATLFAAGLEIGRASGRERVGEYG